MNTDQDSSIKILDHILLALEIPEKFKNLYKYTDGNIVLSEEEEQKRIETLSYRDFSLTVDFRHFISKTKLKKRIQAKIPESTDIEPIELSDLLSAILEDFESGFLKIKENLVKDFHSLVDQLIDTLGDLESSQKCYSKVFSKNQYKPYQVAKSSEKIKSYITSFLLEGLLTKAQKFNIRIKLTKSKNKTSASFELSKEDTINFLSHDLIFYFGSKGFLPYENLKTLIKIDSKDEFKSHLDGAVYDNKKEFQKAYNKLKDIIAMGFEALGENRHKVEKSYLKVVTGVFKNHPKFNTTSSLIKKTQKKLKVFAAEFEHKEEVYLLKDRSYEYSDYPASFPIARSLNRKITFFTGPTNSGKTYHALNRLVEHESGVYLAPLRLLALEGQDEIEKRGKECTFLTGEERDIKEGAKFTSSTIELLNLNLELDCALIDEVQLISDSNRGWAWTAALVGVPAKELVLTGSEDAIPAIKELFDQLGEEFEVKRFQRLSPLEINPGFIPVEKVTPKSAIIAFSRKDVLDLKDYIESTSNHKVSVIYGNLSPDVRREEAKRFRTGETDVLISTDAIAMGLNLPIDKVIFFDIFKFDGVEQRNLTPSELKQIAGRAGRFGISECGKVATNSPRHMEYVKKCLDTNLYKESPILPIFKVKPELRHVNLIGDVVGEGSLQKILLLFKQAINFDSNLFLPDDMDDMILLSEIMDKHLDAPLSVKLKFSQAPCDPIAKEQQDFLMTLIYAFNQKDESEVISFFEDLKIDFNTEDLAKSRDQLLSAEICLKILTLYAWISYRYPVEFREIETCESLRKQVATYIEQSLRSGSLKRRCMKCKKPLPVGFRYNKCERCFSRGYYS